ncbi:SAM-dependent methyltransferase [Actinophytocola gossypii]|uniref:SAM-dependent methyltransferase n=1 Tax=Actinophytocola gossypii TaxID=2812003 RepID=A0ABT2J711_9PSEU|nr:SAM-dependent methyltransferase [Actinophytocola gossypii]MCT2583561.1 SAM-dependent methyltransferase [Actinophytocola gossypii]
MNPLPPTDVRQLDLEKPNAARMYDYHLGGAHNFEADRVLAARVEQVAPWVRYVARINRSWLRRAVTYLMGQGIRQYLDLGSGIPTAGNVHEIVQRIDPATRVVYVDYESVAVHHSHELLKDDPNTTVVWADVRDPRSVLEHPETTRMLDFTQPVGVLVAGLLLFIGDEYDPAGLVRAYREACTGGGYLAISTMSRDEADQETAEQLAGLLHLYESADEQVYPRDRATIESWFAGTELVEPGLVLLDAWRPEGKPSDSPARLLGYGGVGRF